MYYLNIFFIFSIIGHIIENIVYTHVDSGILYGFWTPIYGLGTLLIITINHILDKIKINKKKKPLLLFIFSAVFLSTLEFIGGTIIEFIFGRVFWDYSYQKFHIGKYTSLAMSLIWGLASLLLIYILMPLLDKIIKKIPKWVTWILIILFVIDCIVTFIALSDKLFKVFSIFII